MKYGVASHLGNRSQVERTRALTRRGVDELVEEAVDHLVAYNERFEEKVRDSQAAVQRGETVTDDSVRAWLEERERS